MIFTFITSCKDSYSFERLIELITEDYSGSHNINRYDLFDDDLTIVMECNPFFVHRTILEKKINEQFKITSNLDELC